MLIVAGNFVVPPESHEPFVAAIGALVAPTRAEEGCLDFEFWADLARRGRFHVFEVWATEERFAAHLTTAHLLAFREERDRLGAEVDLRRYRAEPVPAP